MVKNIETIKYPDFTGLEGYILNKKVPIETKLFGSPIHWQVKEDGENTGIYLDSEGEIQVRTRNTAKVAEDIRQRFLDLDCAQNVKNLLTTMNNDFPNEDIVLFGEMCMKGKSPKRIEVRDENRFVAFDLWFSHVKRTPPILNWPAFEKLCKSYDIPTVQLVEVTTVNSLEEMMAVRDRLLAKCKENLWEGVVGKVYVENEHGGFVNFVKEKVDSLPRVRSPKSPYADLPDLPDSEITGAIEKVFFSMGQEKFSVAETAMPEIARLVKEQCIKHGCRPPGDRSYRLYRERLMRL